jgi:hypothetical protein
MLHKIVEKHKIFLSRNWSGVSECSHIRSFYQEGEHLFFYCYLNNYHQRLEYQKKPRKAYQMVRRARFIF